MESREERESVVVSKKEEVALQSTFLQEEIQRLETEVHRIQAMIETFASKIRTLFADEIIEEQELANLYRELQKAKKAKRRSTRDKQRGVKQGTVKVTSKSPSFSDAKFNSSASSSETVNKKRLYREAMLQVHPDKFAQEEELEERAAEVTRTLIDIYQSDDSVKLAQYHAFVMSGQALAGSKSKSKPSASEIALSAEYLLSKKQELEQTLKELKEEQLYIVLTTYDDPNLFMGEIRAYFEDRLMKLRKRTRKARK